MFCWKCGKELEKGKQICASCGSHADGPQQPVQQSQVPARPVQPQLDGVQKVALAGKMIAAVITIIVGVAYMFAGFSKVRWNETLIDTIVALDFWMIINLLLSACGIAIIIAGAVFCKRKPQKALANVIVTINSLLVVIALILNIVTYNQGKSMRGLPISAFGFTAEWFGLCLSLIVIAAGIFHIVVTKKYLNKKETDN